MMLLATALSVAACSTTSDAEPAIRPLGDPEATTTSATPSTSSAPTTEPDPWARPATPDAAYFERVLNELEEIHAEAFRLIRAESSVTPKAEALLRATKTGLNLDYSLGQAALFANEFPDHLTLERPPLLSEIELVEPTSQCVLLQATVSFSDVYTGPRAAERAFIRLLATEATDTNPTGWLTEQRWEVGSEPELSCTSG